MSVDLLKAPKMPRGAFSSRYTQGRGLGEKVQIYWITSAGVYSMGPITCDGHHMVKGVRIPPGFILTYDSEYTVEYSRLSQCTRHVSDFNGRVSWGREHADRIHVNLL